MNPAQITIVFLVVYSIIATAAFLITSFSLINTKEDLHLANGKLDNYERQRIKLLKEGEWLPTIDEMERSKRLHKQMKEAYGSPYAVSKHVDDCELIDKAIGIPLE